MRTIIILTIFMLSNNSVASEQVDEKDFEKLSMRYLNAIQEENIDKYIACWMSFEQMIESYNKIPEGVPKLSKEQLDVLHADIKERDQYIEKSYAMTINTLKKIGIDISKLKYISSDGVLERKGVLEKTGNVDMLFGTDDGKTILISVDDGAKVNGKWYFTDRPHNGIRVNIGGNEGYVFIDRK